MLSSILSKKQCAACKFCCSFRRQSLWETPLFPPEVAEKLSTPNEYGVVGGSATVELSLADTKLVTPKKKFPAPSWTRTKAAF